MAQAIVGIFICGAVTLIAYHLTSSDLHNNGVSEQLVFALRCQIAPGFMLFAGIEAVAIIRGVALVSPRLAAIAPKSLPVHRRYIQNTLEQLVLFFIATMVLSTFPTTDLRVLPIMMGLFVLGRILFWIGYVFDPLYRALGMTMTAVPTVIALFYDVYWLLFG
jgi:hypothetical protein